MRPPADDLVAAARSVGVRAKRVLDAVAAVRRELFVPVESVACAQRDEPLRIPHGLVTTQPSLVAVMVEALELTGTEMVLEVGTGYGYQTALLAHLARQVWSIEWWPDLAATAINNLARAGIDNATVEVGDGGAGLPEHAPFHAIVIAAATPAVPPPLVEQLADGGRLVAPIGPGGNEQVRVFRRYGGTLVADRDLTPAHFVILVGRHGA